MIDLPYTNVLAFPVSPSDELFGLNDYFDALLVPAVQRNNAQLDLPAEGPEFLMRIDEEVVRVYWGACRYLRAKRGWNGTAAVPHRAGAAMVEVQ